jgi:gamma-glutamylcyclotransferase (GGCT)/AIG2-like uncharacterized protein YtfP
MAFPYIIERDQEHGKIIKGEVYEVDKETLRRLDRLEGVPSHYKRDHIYVAFKNGTPSCNVLTYVKATPISKEYEAHMNYIDEFTEEIRVGFTA